MRKNSMTVGLVVAVTIVAVAAILVALLGPGLASTLGKILLAVGVALLVFPVLRAFDWSRGSADR